MIQLIMHNFKSNHSFSGFYPSNRFSPDSFIVSYQEAVKSLYSVKPDSFMCPHCSSRELSRHSSYSRTVIYALNNQTSSQSNESFEPYRYFNFDVEVVKCHSCNSFHAILPIDIPPFCHFSYGFIFDIIHFFHTNNSDKKLTRSVFHLSSKMIDIILDNVLDFFLTMWKNEFMDKLICSFSSLKERSSHFLAFLRSFLLSQSSNYVIPIFFELYHISVNAASSNMNAMAPPLFLI